MGGYARLFRSAISRLRGVKTIALIGRSGTGKSFRAFLVAEKMDIDLIVDDGLLIFDNSIVGGRSAKRKKTLLAATRTALFEGPGESEEAHKALREVPYRRVLVVATSRAMAFRIARNLGMPGPSTVIDIADISSRDELAEASRHRRKNLHAVPVPAVHIRQPLLFSLGARVLALIPRGRRAQARHVTFHPARDSTKSGRGSLRYSPAAVHQMVLHCVQQYDDRIEVERVGLSKMRSPPVLEVCIRVPYGEEVAGGLNGLREYILASLEKYSGLLFDRVNLTVEAISPS